MCEQYFQVGGQLKVSSWTTVTYQWTQYPDKNAVDFPNEGVTTDPTLVGNNPVDLSEGHFFDPVSKKHQSYFFLAA